MSPLSQRILEGIVDEMRRLDGRLEDLAAALPGSPQEERLSAVSQVADETLRHEFITRHAPARPSEIH